VADPADQAMAMAIMPGLDLVLRLQPQLDDVVVAGRVDDPRGPVRGHVRKRTPTAAGAAGLSATMAVTSAEASFYR
jgi:hypothetical protein